MLPVLPGAIFTHKNKGLPEETLKSSKMEVDFGDRLPKSASRSLAIAAFPICVCNSWQEMPALLCLHLIACLEVVAISLGQICIVVDLDSVDIVHLVPGKAVVKVVDIKPGHSRIPTAALDVDAIGQFTG